MKPFSLGCPLPGPLAQQAKDRPLFITSEVLQPQVCQAWAQRARAEGEGPPLLLLRGLPSWGLPD